MFRECIKKLQFLQKLDGTNQRRNFIYSLSLQFCTKCVNKTNLQGKYQIKSTLMFNCLNYGRTKAEPN